MPVTLIELDCVSDEVYELELVFNAILDDEEVERGVGCVAYAFTELGGQGFSAPSNIRRVNGATRVHVFWNSTKVASHNWHARINDVLDKAEVYVMDGTPRRTTKGGTRLVEGIETGVDVYALVPARYRNVLTVTDSHGTVVATGEWESDEKPTVWEYSYELRSDLVE